jgi:hypothetical protein
VGQKHHFWEIMKFIFSQMWFKNITFGRKFRMVRREAHSDSLRAEKLPISSSKWTLTEKKFVFLKLFGVVVRL